MALALQELFLYFTIQLRLMTAAMSLPCDRYIFLCSCDSQGPSNSRQRKVSMRHVPYAG